MRSGAPRATLTRELFDASMDGLYANLRERWPDLSWDGYVDAVEAVATRLEDNKVIPWGLMCRRIYVEIEKEFGPPAVNGA